MKLTIPTMMLILSTSVIASIAEKYDIDGTYAGMDISSAKKMLDKKYKNILVEKNELGMNYIFAQQKRVQYEAIFDEQDKIIRVMRVSPLKSSHNQGYKLSKYIKKQLGKPAKEIVSSQELTMCWGDCDLEKDKKGFRYVTEIVAKGGGLAESAYDIEKNNKYNEALVKLEEQKNSAKREEQRKIKEAEERKRTLASTHEEMKKFNIKGIYLGMSIKSAKNAIPNKYGKTEIKLSNSSVKFEDKIIDTKKRKSGYISNRELNLFAASGYDDYVYSISRTIYFDKQPSVKKLSDKLMKKYGEPTYKEFGNNVFVLCYGDCHRKERAYFSILYKKDINDDALYFKAVDPKKQKMSEAIVENDEEQMLKSLKEKKAQEIENRDVEIDL